MTWARRPPTTAPLADLLHVAGELVQLSNEIVADVQAIASGGGVPQPPPPQPPPTPPPPPAGNIQWPSYTGVATFVGTSTDGITNVYYDASLGAQNLTCAQAVLNAAPAINAGNNKIFGITNATPVNVIVFALGGATDGTGGADHMACDFVNGGNIEVCSDFSNPSFCPGLYEAELSECAMTGNLCGQSNGEALSRWCALVLANNSEFAEFASAPVWAQAGFPNWVDNTENTDQDYNSIGCGMAFISWCISTQGLTLEQLAQTMVMLASSNNTLAAVYMSLKKVTTSPWANFLAACKAVSDGITTDDPFGALSTATAMYMHTPKSHALKPKA
jgi:hypothetical protein